MTTSDLASSKARAVIRAGVERDFLLPIFSSVLDTSTSLVLVVPIDDGCALICTEQPILAAMVPPSVDNAAKILALAAKHDATTVGVVLQGGTIQDVERFCGRLAPFAVDTTVLRLDGDLSPHELNATAVVPTPQHQLAHHVAPETMIEIEQRAQQVGALTQVEYGILTVHILGLEIARFDPQDQQLHVGVGLHDRLARFDGAAEAFGEDDLQRTARQTQLHRFNGSDSTHPLATLQRNRWRRTQLLASHHVVAWNVDPAEPSVGVSIDDVVAFRDDTQLVCCANPNDLGAVSAAAAIRQREFGIAPMTLSFWQHPAQAVLRQVALVDQQLGPITVRVDPSPWSN